jgi:4-hydroxymandelate oxidase
VENKIPILFDGGIRRGSDIIKAIALGASAVMIGRPIMYALATAGALGVAHTLKILKEELEVSMIFTGCKDIEAIKALNLD